MTTEKPLKIIVTIHERTPAAALEAIRAIDGEHDGVELRVDGFEAATFDLRSFRLATPKMLILTDRTGGDRRQNLDLSRATESGFDYVDVEFRSDLDRELIAHYADRIILSHHDYEKVPDLEPLIESMARCGCAVIKVAATPSTFAENMALLRAGHDFSRPPTRLTVIGMGERGLYARILAPFFGSELLFVGAAAPGQFSLARARAIYGEGPLPQNPRIFCIAGNPAGHSLSPEVHNSLFRQQSVAAAYAVASVERFAEVAEPFAAAAPFAPTGMSITAPFKEEAFAFARQLGARLGANALECGAVNTLVRIAGEIRADNTDVDGFETVLRGVCGRDRKSAAIVGAGGTARAAMVAARRLGLEVMLYNRTVERGRTLARAFGVAAGSLDDLRRFDGEVVIDTTPSADLDVSLRAGMTYVRASYGGASPLIDRAREAGAQIIDGVELLHAQAARQNELFVEACR